MSRLLAAPLEQQTLSGPLESVSPFMKFMAQAILMLLKPAMQNQNCRQKRRQNRAKDDLQWGTEVSVQRERRRKS